LPVYDHLVGAVLTWHIQSLFVAEGRIAGPSEIEYRIYRVM
jgi:hypothetical protein